ncbi:MAG: MOSC domain-containing protein [Planctomycetales bacterium]
MNSPTPDGQVLSIYIVAQAGAPLSSVNEIRAVAGKGLEGDRYFLAAGTFSNDEHRPDGEVTLLESEKVSEFADAYDVGISPADLRRNIVTVGVSLNDLVDQDFLVGEVRLRGIRLCEPCDHLARLTRRQVLHGLIHRAGLRAQILADGIIRVGDRIEVPRDVKQPTAKNSS